MKKKKVLLFVTLLISVMFILSSCLPKEDDLQFKSLTPANDATLAMATEEVELEWELAEKPKDVTVKYDVYVCETEEGLSELSSLKAKGITDTTYLFEGLEPGKTYFWKIVADADLHYAYSSSVHKFTVDHGISFDTDEFGPENNAEDVSWIASSFEGLAVISFNWLANHEREDEIFTYDFYLDGDLLREGLESPEVDLQGFMPEETVEWYVIAEDSLGNTLKSPEMTFTIKSNTVPTVENVEFYQADGFVQAVWTATDPDGDPIRFDLYDEEDLIVEGWNNTSYNLASGNIDLTVKAYDPFMVDAIEADEDFTYTPPTSVTANATLTLHITDFKTGSYVDGATVKIGEEEKETENGIVEFSFSDVGDYKDIDFVITKQGHAITEYEGLRIRADKEMEYHTTLRYAALNGDPTDQEVPLVEWSIVDLETEEPYSPGETITGPVLITVNATPVSYPDTKINIIYAAFGKNPGAGFFGPRGFASDENTLEWEYNPNELSGENYLHITVYDQNDNQINIMEYYNFIPNQDVSLARYVPQGYGHIFGGTNIDSFTRRIPVAFYSNEETIKSENTLDNFDSVISKRTKERLENIGINKADNEEIFAAPENNNLWVEVWFLPYWLFAGMETPLGYNIYRSFDFELEEPFTIEKVEYVKEDGVFRPVRDYSPLLEAGKEVHYFATSVYSDGETEPNYLGSVTPLDGFNIKLDTPGQKETGVYLNPEFKWTPTVDATKTFEDATFNYIPLIYDLTQDTGKYYYPFDFDEGAILTLEATNTNQFTVDFDTVDWRFQGGDMVPVELLEIGKSYDWTVDLAYAERENDNFGYAISIAIDNGWGMDPFGGVEPDVMNNFTTGSSIREEGGDE